MNKVRDIVIDADHILYNVVYSKTYMSPFEGDCDGDDGDWGEEPTLDLDKYKKHFIAIVNEYIEIAEVESICYSWTIGKTRVVMSDKRNFRYDIYPEYKKDRPESSTLMKKLAKWARKKFQTEHNVEADDVVAYYVRKGALGFTTDKDLFKGVKGIWYNSHYKHKCWVRTNAEEAEKFFKMQVLAGDGVDGIPSLNRVGLITAKDLLEKYGYGWDRILHIFTLKKYGHDKDYMVTMARLVCMSQWSPEKGITLWEFPNEDK